MYQTFLKAKTDKVLVRERESVSKRKNHDGLLKQLGLPIYKTYLDLLSGLSNQEVSYRTSIRIARRE